MSNIIKLSDYRPVQEKDICNVCGKSSIDSHRLETFTYQFGYDSKRDMDLLHMKICEKCQDKLVDKLVKSCKISPIVEWTGDTEKPYGDFAI